MRSMRAFGGTLDRRRPEFGMVHLRVGASTIDLLDVNGPLGARGGEAPGIGGRNVDHLCLRIDQFEELVIQSHARSFGLSAEPAQLRYGAEGTGKFLCFFDPDGNPVELKGPSCPSTQPPPCPVRASTTQPLDCKQCVGETDTPEVGGTARTIKRRCP